MIPLMKNQISLKHFPDYFGGDTFPSTNVSKISSNLQIIAGYIAKIYHIHQIFVNWENFVEWKHLSVNSQAAEGYHVVFVRFI